jgi:hypothetical protein
MMTTNKLDLIVTSLFVHQASLTNFQKQTLKGYLHVSPISH